MMCPSVRRVWDEHQTASMTGRPGRGVAWDYVLEKMNLSYKQFLCGTITEERLNEFGVMINALKTYPEAIRARLAPWSRGPRRRRCSRRVLAREGRGRQGSRRRAEGPPWEGPKTKPTRRPPHSPALTERTRSQGTSACCFPGTKSKRTECPTCALTASISRTSLRRSTRGPPDCAPFSAGGGSGCCGVVPRLEGILLLNSRSTTVVAGPSYTRTTVHFHRPTKSQTP